MKKELRYGQVLPDKKCQCGGQLIYDEAYFVCADCYRLYCPSCHGLVMPAGGCFYCVECGWSACG